MDHDFKDLIGNFMGGYPDDLNIHSKLIKEPIKHLREFLNVADCMVYI
jgi:hypothetical protein